MKQWITMVLLGISFAPTAFAADTYETQTTQTGETIKIWGGQDGVTFALVDMMARAQFETRYNARWKYYVGKTIFGYSRLGVTPAIYAVRIEINKADSDVMLSKKPQGDADGVLLWRATAKEIFETLEKAGYAKVSYPGLDVIKTDFATCLGMPGYVETYSCGIGRMTSQR